LSYTVTVASLFESFSSFLLSIGSPLLQCSTH
jgi:hypothetical protein